MLNALLQNVTALIPNADGFIYLYDDPTDEMVMKAGSGPYAERLLGFRLKMGEGLTGRAAQSGEPVLVEDYQNWSGRSWHPAFKNLRAALSVPIMSHDRVLGTIGMSCFGSDTQFRPEEVDILGRFADLAAIALENARLYNQAQTELIEKQRAEDALRPQRAALPRRFRKHRNRHRTQRAGHNPFRWSTRGLPIWWATPGATSRDV